MGKINDTREHPGEEILESYAMGKLSEADTAGVDEHLLLCEECQDRLQEVDDFVRAFQIAAPEVAREAKTRGRFREILSGLGAWGKPLPVAGALAAAVLAVVFLAPQQAPVLRPHTLELRAVRSSAGSIARSNEALTLRLDIEGLPAQDTYPVTIADSSGIAVWEGKASPAEESLVVAPGQLARSGGYWVRVHKNDAGQSLLREYALEIRD